jgi:hypothetical protein
MWDTASAWFDVALVATGFALGNIFFGRFEEHRPRLRRAIKLAVVLAITVTLSQTVGRVWAYVWMIPIVFLAVWVHAVWLPRNGINGWTAEPRDKYLALVKDAKLSDLWRS